MPHPDEIATWRFEMIAPLVDQSLTTAERQRLLEDRIRRSVRRPNGEERPTGRATLYRWRKAYISKGFDGLFPKRRKDRGRPRADRTKLVEHAIHLLIERPGRTLFLLVELLDAKFPGRRLARATLQRELERHPLWPYIRRRRRRDRRGRLRFQASRPHQIWQLDAKGTFTVRLSDGRRARVTVLTILDDASRAVLAARVASTEDLAAAVRVFRQAAGRWGLPDEIYCDRHSVYDSLPFRTGLATLGVHRIRARPRNAPARGKIEAYHRVLKLWFVDELPHQEVGDLHHLDDLLQATIDLLYQRHRHRGIKMPPAEALAGRLSERPVAPADLQRAFWVTRTLKAHPKTGEVDLPGGLFRVPRAFAGKRVMLRYDPAEPHRTVLVDGAREIPLEPAFPPAAPKAPKPQRGAGALQRLLDVWRGRELPQAPAGFGLPEVFEALGVALGRPVPATEGEAEAIQAFYRDRGPFAPDAFDRALDRATKALGAGRPLQAILHYLDRLLPSARPPDGKESP